MSFGTQSAEDYLGTFVSEIHHTRFKFLAAREMQTEVSSVWAAFEIADAALTRSIGVLHSHADGRRLGYYTYEEEADVFAMNYLLAQGQGPKPLESLFYSFMESALVGHPELAPRLRGCMAAYRQGWKVMGRPYRAVIDDFQDQHHGLCYRLYHLRDIAKNLVVQGSKDPISLPEGEDYGEIRDSYASYVQALK